MGLDYDERRKYLKTPDINTVVLTESTGSYVSRESLKSLLSHSVEDLKISTRGGSPGKKKKRPRQRPRTVHAYTGGSGGGGSGGGGGGIRNNKTNHTRRNNASPHGRAQTTASPGTRTTRTTRTPRTTTSASATSLRISTRGDQRGGLRRRPGTGGSINSDASQEYIACAACHRQRSKFSDFCNVCVK